MISGREDIESKEKICVANFEEKKKNYKKNI